jgi:hypothetical protein
MKKWMVLAIALAASGQWGGAPAYANDSAAAIGVGGIELVQQADVAMVSEDLYVSKPQIRVRYEFRNESAAPVKTLVAFPLPELDLAKDRETPFGWPSDNQQDPVNFQIRVDGKPIQPRLERKAFLKGQDVTKDLEAAGVPVLYPFGDFWTRVGKLKKAEIDRLAAKGLVEVDKATREVFPLWALKGTYYWDQTFPAGQIVRVEHSYAPVIGGSFWGDGNPKTEAAAAKDEYFRDFCLDQQTLDAAARKLAADKARNPQGSAMLSYIDVRYVLMTGRNWKGPIGKFKLTVDKGFPANLVSFCADGVAKTGPTTFVVEKTNWEPDRDLAVLILQSIE